MWHPLESIRHPLQIARSGRSPLRELRCFVSLFQVIRRVRPDLVHLVTEPVVTGVIIARFFPGAAVGEPPADGSASYDFRTRHAAAFGGGDGYIYGSGEVMQRIGAYVTAASARQEKSE